MEQLSYNIKQAVQATGITRTRLYEHIKAGDIKTIKAGRQTIIPKAELVGFIEKLAGAA